MRAIIVSVDYSDLLAITLPYNRHHFDEVMVVTSPTDEASRDVAFANNSTFYITDSFYKDGAAFNKWLPLEEGLNAFGRHGLICILDADVLWPKEVPEFEYENGCLYTPIRYNKRDISGSVPPEAEWPNYPKHGNLKDWSGWTQIFYADDPHLGKPPWHQTNWKHAGGADSIFQQKWPKNYKRRPPFHILHLGKDGVNWCGRVTKYRNGDLPPDSVARCRMLNDFRKRRGTGPDRFDHEKIQ